MKTVLYSAVACVCILTACLSTGCSLCCAPYDYCGPVYQGGACSNLMVQRCGSGVQGPACGPCGANRMAYAPAQNPAQVSPMNMQPVTPGMQMQPVTPGVQPPFGPQVQYMQPTQQAPMVVMQNPAPQQGMHAAQMVPAPQMAQVQPQVGAQVMPVTQSQMQMQGQMPAGTVVVPQQGLVEVQVFDEKGNFLGVEKMDASGNTLNRVPAPTGASMMPQQQMMVVPQMMNQMPQNPMYVQQQGVAYPQVMPVSTSGGGFWKTRTQAKY